MTLSETLTAAAAEAASLEATVSRQASALVEANAAILTRDGVIAQRDAEIVSLRSEVERLEAELAALSPRKPLIGFSSSSSRTTTLDAKRSVYGPSGIVRRFSSDLPSAALLPEDGTPVALSYKIPDPVALEATLKAARDRGISGFWTWHHEPEDNFTTAAQRAEFRETWLRLLDAVETHVPDATLEPMVILMAWTLNPKSGRDWHEFDPREDLPIGFDLYNPSNVPFVLEWAEQTGRGFAIPEIGALGTDAQRYARLEAMVPSILSGDPLFVTYFDSTNGGDYPLNGYPLAAAKWREFATA